MELYGELKVAETVNIQNNSGNDNITDNNVINNNDKKNNKGNRAGGIFCRSIVDK